MDEQTCGKGPAEHSVLPATVGELIAAMAENLEIHQKALDLTDENARKEFDTYVRVAQELRSAASQLRATAQRMAGYRDLPMGKHDVRAMRDPKVFDAFEKFVRVEQELLSLVQSWVDQHRKMLVEMRGAAGKPRVH